VGGHVFSADAATLGLQIVQEEGERNTSSCILQVTDAEKGGFGEKGGVEGSRLCLLLVGRRRHEW